MTINKSDCYSARILCFLYLKQYSHLLETSRLEYCFKSRYLHNLARNKNLKGEEEWNLIH